MRASKSQEHRRKKLAWGSDFDQEEIDRAIALSLASSSDEATALSIGGNIDAQKAAFRAFEAKKEAEDRKKQQQQQQQKQQKQKQEKERAAARVAAKDARREHYEKLASEKRIADKVRDSIVNKAMTWDALAALRNKTNRYENRELASAMSELNRNLSASMRPGRGGGPSIYDDDDDDDDDDDSSSFAFNGACQALSANGTCDAHEMQRYPPTKSLCWVHEYPPSSVHDSLFSAIVEYWRKGKSAEHERKVKSLVRKVAARYEATKIERNGVVIRQSPIKLAAQVIGTCIYVWGVAPSGGAARWTVYHDGTSECGLGSKAPIYLATYVAPTSTRPMYARIKPHTKGSSLPASLIQ
jgi:hypothetical protein